LQPPSRLCQLFQCGHSTLSRQRKDRLFAAGIGELHAGCLILHFEREGLHILNGLFEQFGHVERLRVRGQRRKQKPVVIPPL
jgi:hypothetical protein